MKLVDALSASNELQEAVDALGEFSELTYSYAKWWDWIQLEFDTSHPLAELLSDRSFTEQWGRLQDQYILYVQLVGSVSHIH